LTTAKELMPSVENFLCALSYSYHCDKQELFEAVARMAQAEANRLASLDKSRNWPTIAP
jgi:hypothetical protein